MKTILSTVLILFSLAIMPGSALEKTSANSQHNMAYQDSSQLMVYYFHAKRRCVTCEAVEAVARRVVRENYKDIAEFVAINREDEKNKMMVEKYQVSGQMLIIVKGNKVEDLTNNAFMNARKNPEKLEEKMKELIDTLK